VLTHFAVSDDVAPITAPLHRRPLCQDNDGGRAAGRRTRQQPDHHQHARRATGGKPSVTSRTSRPRTRWPWSTPRPQQSHPSRPVPASRSPRRRANQARPLLPHRGRTVCLRLLVCFLAR